MEYGFITRAIKENISKISPATAKRDISLLKKLDLIKFEGARKTGRLFILTVGLFYSCLFIPVQ